MAKNNFNLSFIVFTMMLVVGLKGYGNQYNDPSKVKYLGQYRVPVNDENLLPYSNFPIKVKIKSNDQQSKLYYELPLELAGRNIELAFQVQAIEYGYRLEGPLGSGECNRKFSQVVCKMEYNKDLNINLNEVDQYLKSTGTVPSELEQRQAVAQLFSVDPIGILSFEIK